MIGKSLLAGALALALLPSAFPQERFAEAPYDHPFVKQVRCAHSLGTAFMIEGGKFLSVHHVTKNEGCTIDGAPFIVDYADPAGDFSILTVPGQRGAGIEVDCDGFSHGRNYYAIGYARGAPWQTSVTLRADAIATLIYGRGLFQLFKRIETVIPGQSGGPIIGADGRVRGMVNAYNPDHGLSWSRSLSETQICEPFSDPA